MKQLESIESFGEAIEQSLLESDRPIFIYKHSTRCFISKMAWGAIQEEVRHLPENSFYFLDIIRYRDVSNAISRQLSVEHESPQLLKIQNGKCIGAVSHEGVTAEQLKSWCNT